MHRACEHDAYQKPNSAGQIAHLCGHYRAYERSGARDSGEMVAEKDVFVRRDVISPVVSDHRRSCAAIVQLKDAIRDKAPVEGVSDQIDARAGYYEPDGADALAFI